MQLRGVTAHKPPGSPAPPCHCAADSASQSPTSTQPQARTALHAGSTGHQTTADTAQGSVAEARARLAAVVAVARLFLTGDAIAGRLGVPASTVSRLAHSAEPPNVERGWHPYPGREGLQRWFDGRCFTRTRPVSAGSSETEIGYRQ